MDEQRQDGQLEPIYNSSVAIQDVTLKTSRKRWTIETDDERGRERERERESGRSVLAARHDDDDNDDDEEGELKRMDSCLSQAHHSEVKPKQLRPRFELWSLIPFFITLTAT